MKPTVAIVGRSNVGKSTLFNRLAARRKAIVFSEPGVTRDRIYAEANWQGKSFLLIDTGGYEPEATDEIFVLMREQTRLAIEEANVILLLFDGKAGLMPQDRELASLLREVDKPVFVVVNKIDNERHKSYINEFYELGAEKLYPISALHGTGIDELMEEVLKLPCFTEISGEEEDNAIKIAVVGRPNVGKSSLINRILGYERTIVSKIPGTTRDAIDTPFTLGDKKYVLIDTAGIRRKSKISLILEKYCVVQALKAIERCDIALLLLDAAEGVTEQDTKIAGLALEKGAACIIVVNKWDKIKKDNQTVGSYIRMIKEHLKFMDFAPIIFISALKGQRVMKIFDLIDEVYGQYTKRVNTALLNEKVREIVLSNPPPLYGNESKQRISYVTQILTKPPTFLFFVKEPRGIHFSYERYLVNQLRERLGFTQVPIRLLFRKKR